MAAAVACGDSATGSDIPDADDDGGTSSGRDGGSSGRDGSGSSSSGSTSSSSSGGLDSGKDTGTPSTDGGLPTVDTTTVEFGQTDCGTTATSKKFVINNPSGAAVTFTTELVKGASSPYTLTPASGSVPAGGSIEVTVDSKQITAGPSTSTNDNAFGDTVKLTVGPTSLQVNLRQTARGAVIKLLTNSGTDFGNVPTGGAGNSLPLQVSNAGNVAAPITLSVVEDPTLDGGASPFTITGSGAADPAPTSAAAQQLTPANIRFSPAAVASFTGKIRINIGNTIPLCDASPADVTYTGKGTDGVVAFSAAAITFGNASAATTDCGTQGLQQILRVTNSSNKAFLIKSATLQKGNTNFTLNGTSASTLSNVNVPANGSTDITIIPRLIAQNHAVNPTAPNAFGDTLTITTDAPGDTDPHVIPLNQTARGAYVVRVAPSLNLGTVAVGITSAPTTLTYQNQGNVPINLVQSLSQGTQFAATPTDMALSVGAPPTTASVTFTPTTTGAFTDNLGIVQKPGENVVLCTNTLPTPLSVSGTGGTAQIVANNSSTGSTLAFGGIACGTAAPESKQLRITNNGAAGDFTVKLRKAISPFTLSTAGGPIAAGATVIVDVTPKPVGNDFGTVGGQDDIIDVTSTTASNTPAVTVNFTPQGAIIAVSGLSSGAVSFGTQSRAANPAGVTRSLTLTNNGNVAIPLTLAVATTSPGGAPANTFTGLPPSMNLQPGGASAQLTNVTFNPASNGAFGGTLTVAPGPSGVLCAPLPQGSTLANGVYPLSGTGAN